MATVHLSDEEVDEICAGLVQNFAKIRFLRKLGFRVDRKPNGRPLVWRPVDPAPHVPAPAREPDREALLALFRNRANRRPTGG